MIQLIAIISNKVQYLSTEFRINDNSINQLNTSQIQTCTNSKIILGKVKMFCVRGNQTNVFVSHTTQFFNTNDFNASILFDATRLDRFVYSGQISYSSQMQMFSLVSSGSLRITSSNIMVSQLQCPSAALLSSRGALVLNNSAVSFSHSGQASGGLVFESLDMAVFNVAFACSITASSGGLFAFSASGKLVLDRFSATGAFNVPNPNLVNTGSQLAITIRNASAAFFVQNRCASGSCSMSGLLVAGLDPAFSCSSNAEYCGMRQVLFGDYHQKEIVVDGVAVQARCAVEGVQDFNYSYVRVDESVSGARANSSLFCYRPVFTRMIVSGSYQVTGSGLDVSSGSIFVASPDQLVTLQNSKVVVTFVTFGQADISVFLNQDKNTISVISSNFSITLQPNSQASFFGVSKSSKSVSVTGCRFVFSSTSLNEFCGISRFIASLQINTLLLQMNVNAFVAYGFGQMSSGTVSTTLVTLDGQLTGANTYGILYQAQSQVSLSSFQYSLKTIGSSQNCGFIQVISQANVVTTSNIVFSGFSGRPNILSSFVVISSSCPCNQNSILQQGLCYCLPTYNYNYSINNCECHLSTVEISGHCVCQVPQTTLVDNICTCDTQNAFINGSSCACAVNATNITNICTCPYGSILENNICICQTNNAFPIDNICSCAIGAMNVSNNCECPINSLLVSGACQCQIPQTQLISGICKCDTSGAIIVDSHCTCGTNGTNTSNTCSCPTGSSLIDGICKCATKDAFPLNGACTCGINATNSSNQCICPSGSTLLNGICVCQTFAAFPVSGVCTCATNATNSSNSCVCPTNSIVLEGICKCSTTNAFPLNGACACGVNATNSSNTCSCPIGSILLNGICACQTTSAFPVSGECKCATNAYNSSNSCVCPSGTQLLDGACQCIIPDTSFKSGSCQCNTVNAFISNYACICGINGINSSNSCSCPTGSSLSVGVCTCSTPNALISPSGCACAINATNSSNSCQCPTGSTISGNACKCATKNAFPVGGACACGINATNSSNTCSCPTGSSLIDGICKCATKDAFPLNGACTCGINATNSSNQCICPSGSNLLSGICVCLEATSYMFNNVCVLPITLGQSFHFTGRLQVSSFGNKGTGKYWYGDCLPFLSKSSDPNSIYPYLLGYNWESTLGWIDETSLRNSPAC
ncbi:Conserved_hypothetical protein [Hexamita inflata]|uniref:Uncharacterized protein n=1 Tax=Hexamita inflata TaxID=28002 RepID=A0AA86UJS2_9EUKA|nr:Conserved hypothetical protein [Hexamita inflata]